MNLFLSPQYPKSFRSGFTLIEVLTVFSVIIFITISLLANVSRGKPSLIEASQVLMSDIRLVQANALASKQFKDPATGILSYRCGYGLSHFAGNSNQYFLYAGRLFSGASNCPGPKTYSNSNSTPIIFPRVLDSRLELIINSEFRDIYFQSPDGMVFIDNNACPVVGGLGKSQIIIRKKGVSCPSSNCIYVCIYASGKIESRTDDCPNIAC